MGRVKLFFNKSPCYVVPAHLVARKDPDQVYPQDAAPVRFIVLKGQNSNLKNRAHRIHRNHRKIVFIRKKGLGKNIINFFNTKYFSL